MTSLCRKVKCGCIVNICIALCSSDSPHGIDITRKTIEKANEPLRPPEVLVVNPNHEPGKPQVSSIALRHVFQLDPNAVDMSTLPPPPKREFIKPQSNRRNVRNIRLRPRKVLCSNCKQGIQENGKAEPNPVKNVTTRSSAKQAQSNSEPRSITNSVPIQQPEPDPSPRKSKKGEKSDDNKKVPVLKLSLARPRGGTVLTIPKADIQRGQENDDPESSKPEINHEEYRKMKKLQKAIKKAKLKEKLEKGSPESPIAENGHHKWNKKHKVKRKHKYKDLEPNDCKQSDNSNENFELKVPHASQKKEDEYAISNADEFTKLKHSTCIVRLEKIDVEQQSKPQSTVKSESETHVDTNTESEHQQNASIESEPQISSQNDMDNVSSPISTPESPVSPEPDHKTEPSSSGTMYQVQVSDISDPEDEEPNSPPYRPKLNPAANLSAYSTAYNSAIQPLLMRIQTRTILHLDLEDGRALNVGDVVWGKIQGFPWWPARIIDMSQSLKEGIVMSSVAQVSWYGSTTMSYIDCLELYPYLEYYKERYTKRKKGVYRAAVKQATDAAKQIALKTGSYVDGSIFDTDSETYDDYDSLPDVDDITNYQSLDKENLDSMDTQGMLGYDELKPIQDDSVTTTPTQTPTRIGKSDSLNEEIEQFNNMEDLDSYSRQYQDDLNSSEVLET